ncbi:MAG: hypothetical protein QXV58_15155 [Saccharolobus sp.]|uniref:hypothetical protein n=1 Tax=Saccharolobus sp. TaxID=2100761 RepID=UPI003160CF29
MVKIPYISQEQYIGIVLIPQEITLLQYTVQESGTYYATVFAPTLGKYRFRVYLNGNVVDECPNNSISIPFMAQKGDKITIKLLVYMVSSPLVIGVDVTLLRYDEKEKIWLEVPLFTPVTSVS